MELCSGIYTTAPPDLISMTLFHLCFCTPNPTPFHLPRPTSPDTSPHPVTNTTIPSRYRNVDQPEEQQRSRGYVPEGAESAGWDPGKRLAVGGPDRTAPPPLPPLLPVFVYRGRTNKLSYFQLLHRPFCSAVFCFPSDSRC